MDIDTIRRTNLESLINEKSNGNKAQFSKTLSELTPEEKEISPSSISRLFIAGKNARKISTKFSRRIEKAFKLTHGWMDINHQYGIEESNPEYNQIADKRGLPEGKYKYISFYNTQFAGGNGSTHTEFQETKQDRAFRSNWLESEGLNATELKIVVVTGESMMPRLYDGDQILIKTTCTNIKNGKVYAFRYGNELKVKRLETRYDWALIINSDNPSPEYKQEIIPKSDLESIQIAGRVIKIVSGGGF